MKITIIKIVGLIILITVVVAAIISFAPKAGQEAESTSFFSQFIVAGGALVWFLLIPLSVITAYLAFDLSLSIRRSILCPPSITENLLKMINNPNNHQWMIEINKKEDLISQAVAKILLQRSLSTTALETILAEAVEIAALKIQRRIEWINIVANIAPMIGLFGTVYGMILAFNGIVIAGGQPQPAQLAGGISVALVTTFWGLLIAIPAISIHGFLSIRLESIAALAMSEAEMLIPALKQAVKQERSFVRNKLYQTDTE